MLTHDSGACLIQNGGGEVLSDDDNDDAAPANNQNQGVVIREIADDEENGDVDELVPIVEVPEAADALGDIAPLRDPLPSRDELDEPNGAYSMFNEERNMSEMFNPIPIFANATGDLPGNPNYQRYSALIHTDSSIMLHPLRDKMQLQWRGVNASERTT